MKLYRLLGGSDKLEPGSHERPRPAIPFNPDLDGPPELPRMTLSGNFFARTRRQTRSQTWSKPSRSVPEVLLRLFAKRNRLVLCLSMAVVRFDSAGSCWRLLPLVRSENVIYKREHRVIQGTPLILFVSAATLLALTPRARHSLRVKQNAPRWNDRKVSYGLSARLSEGLHARPCGWIRALRDSHDLGTPFQSSATLGLRT